MSGEDIGAWGVADVAQWLTTEGFGEEWSAAFAENEIDGEALKLLKDPGLLTDMGVPRAVGARLKFWQKLDVLTEAGRSAPISATVSEVPGEPAPTPSLGTQTLRLSTRASNPASVQEAAAVAGLSMAGPMRDVEVEQVVAAQKAFIDKICELLADLDANDRDVALLLDLKENLSRLFSVVVVGEFNAGKSSLINAILGSKFCAEGVVPTTATINMLRYGEGDEGGKIQRNTDYQELFLPSPILKQVTIVDTPGTNAIIKEQTRLTKGFVPQSDLVLFVTSAERPITETEGKLLEYIREWGKKVVLVLNKIDLFEDEESYEKVRTFVRANAANILGVDPPVYGVAGRLALQAKLGMADPEADQEYAQKLWEKSRFADLEGYITEVLMDRKLAVKLKLETPLGVSEKFLGNYKRASELGGQITDDDKKVLEQLKASMLAFDADVELQLRDQLARLDSLLNQAQERAKTAASSVLSPVFIAKNLPGCLTKSSPIDAELRRAMDLNLEEELQRLTDDFGRTLRDKHAAQWNLCSALIGQRLKSRQWKQITLEKPDMGRADALLAGVLAGGPDGTKQSALNLFDPEVETKLLSASLTSKAFDSAVATAAVAATGLLSLEVFNAAALDIGAFILTAGGLFYSLGVYPSLLQDEVLGDLDTRAFSWKSSVKEDLATVFKDAARLSTSDMTESFAPYIAAVAVENDKWNSVKERVGALDGELKAIRALVEGL